MMTIPGLFLFYGSLVRSKKILATIMHSFIMVGVISVQWVLWGYSLAFGPDIGGVLGSIACSLKPKFGYDDSLDVVGVHGVGGTWGALATGLFASKAVNAAGNDGLFFGNPGQLWTQFIGVAVTIVFAMVMTAIILAILKAAMGLRVADDEERMGLDLTQHNERAYE